ncbi:MAG: hypothetical protein EA380_03755 [Phycisphaeraceae bacterium]|nr:MAG: hypothetical protein EA380_03755 [Phycisphaeraceae bacterium]
MTATASPLRNAPTFRRLFRPLTLFLSGTLLIILGSTVAILALVLWSDSLIPQQRTPIPGQIVVTGSESYDVYLETRSRIDGQLVQGNIPDTDIVLTGAGIEVFIPEPSDEPERLGSYELKHYSGQKIFQLRTETTGDTTISAAYREGARPTGQPVIAIRRTIGVGESIGPALISLGGFSALAIPGAGLILLAGLLLSIKLCRSRKQHAAPA